MERQKRKLYFLSFLLVMVSCQHLPGLYLLQKQMEKVYYLRCLVSDALKRWGELREQDYEVGVLSDFQIPVLHDYVISMIYWNKAVKDFWNPSALRDIICIEVKFM